MQVLETGEPLLGHILIEFGFGCFSCKLIVFKYATIPLWPGSQRSLGM